MPSDTLRLIRGIIHSIGVCVEGGRMDTRKENRDVMCRSIYAQTQVTCQLLGNKG